MSDFSFTRITSLHSHTLIATTKSTTLSYKLDDVDNAYSFHESADLFSFLIQALNISENEFCPTNLPDNLITALNLDVNPPSDTELRTYHRDITYEWTLTFSVNFESLITCGPFPRTGKGYPAQIVTSLDGDSTASQSKLALSDSDAKLGWMFLPSTKFTTTQNPIVCSRNQGWT